MKTLYSLFLSLYFIPGSAQFSWIKQTPVFNGVQATAQAGNGDFYVLCRADTVNKIYRLDSNAVLVGEITFPRVLELGQLKINSLDQLVVAGGLWYQLSINNSTLVSSGKSDIFIGMLDKDFNWIRASRYGGKGNDKCSGLAIDSQDNNIICGWLADTVFFDSTRLVSPGWYNVFVAKISSSGQVLQTLTDDSQSDALNSNMNSRAVGISINQDDEILLSGDYGGRAYFSFAGYSLPTYSMQGASFLYRLNPDFSPQWAKSLMLRDRWIAWEHRQYTFTSRNTFEIFSEGAMGVSHSVIYSYDNSADTISTSPTYNPGPFGNPSNANYFLGVIDDEVYTTSSLLQYDEFGEHKAQYFCRFRTAGYDPIAFIEGDLYPFAIHKNSSSSAYLMCRLMDTATVGSTTLYPEKFRDQQLVIAKLAVNLKTVGIEQATSPKAALDIHPNPTAGTVHFSTGLGMGTEYKVQVMDGTGRVLANEHYVEDGRGGTFSLGDLSKGVYHLRMESKNASSVQKVILR